MLQVPQPYRIASIEIEGNHLFSVAGFKKIHINFNTPLTLILGTNGCGKSALLSELNPLPANAAHYTQSGGKANGFKEIAIDCDGRHYVLRSEFKEGKGTFTFEVDGVHMNPTGAVTIYRELVYQHFGYNNDVRDILTGRLSFTTMSVAERRKWLTYVSNCDYTFALAYYRKLTEEHRDVQGTIKRINARLLTERAKLLNAEEFELQRQRHAELDNLIKEVMQHSEISNPKPEEVVREYEATKESFLGLCRDIATLSRKRQQIKANEVISDKPNRIIELERESAVLDSKLSAIYEKLQVTMQRIEEMEHEHVGSLEDVKLKLDVLWHKKSECAKNVELDLVWEDPELALSSLKSAMVTLLEALGRISPDETGRYSRENYERATLDLGTLRGAIHNTKETMEYIDGHLKKLKGYATHDPTECPNCNHRWIVGHSVERMSQLGVEYVEHKSTLEIQEAKEKELAEYVDAVRERLSYLQEFFAVFNPYPALKPLRTYMAENKLPNLSPNAEAVRVVYRALDDLQQLVELKYTERDIATLEHLRKVMEEDKEKGVAAVFDAHAALEAEAATLHRQRDLVSREIDAQRLWASTGAKIEIALREVQVLRRQMRVDIPAKLTQHTKSMVCAHIVTNIQKEKDTLNDLIYKHSVQQAVITGLEQEIAALSKEEELLKMAIDALSPKEGLIAKGLTGFINRFLMRINAFMARVWSYPIELSMLTMDDESELDYRFPVIVDDRASDPVPDVSDLSNGQAEVVNFAFRLVSMVCLRMSMYPLFLDEFGAKMDAKHRVQAFELATSMLSQADFSQIFMVSHHESTYSSLVECDAVVLEGSNVVVPKHFRVNESVAFVR